MAELDAFGKAVKGFAVTPTLNADGSALISLDGVQNYHPRLRLSAAETAAVARTFAAKPAEPPPKEEPKPGDVIWVGDPAHGVPGDWARAETVPGRITTPPDSRFAGGKAYDLELRSGDRPIAPDGKNYGERCELANGNCANEKPFKEGDDLWLAIPFLIPAGYPLAESHGSFNLLMQIHQRGGNYPPPMSIDLEQGGAVIMSNPSEAQGNKRVGFVPLDFGHVHRLLVHGRYTYQPTGGFDVYLDGQRIVSTTQQTIFASGSTSHPRIGTYRSDSFGKSDNLRFGKVAIAKTQAAAEAAAF